MAQRQVSLGQLSPSHAALLEMRWDVVEDKSNFPFGICCSRQSRTIPLTHTVKALETVPPIPKVWGMVEKGCKQHSSLLTSRNFELKST